MPREFGRLEQGSLVPDGSAAADGVIRLRDEKLRGIPCGLAVSRDGKELFVANVWGQTVSRVRLDGGLRRRPAGEGPLRPGGELLREGVVAGGQVDERHGAGEQTADVVGGGGVGIEARPRAVAVGCRDPSLAVGHEQPAAVGGQPHARRIPAHGDESEAPGGLRIADVPDADGVDVGVGDVEPAAVSRDGRELFVANVWGQSVSRVRLGGAGPQVDELALADVPAAAPKPPATSDDPSITKRAAAVLEKAVADSP